VSHYLTTELRRRFEALGEDVVQHDVLNRRLNTDELAGALAWLAEQRNRKQRIEAVRFWILTSLLVVLTGVVVTGLVALRPVIH
jgi:hypothetical protein